MLFQRTFHLILWLVSFVLDCSAQADIAAIQALYTRAMQFDESKVDSIAYYAQVIDETSKALNLPLGTVFSFRLQGLFYRNKSEYEKAIDYYLRSLQEARKLDEVTCQIAALTDLGAVYRADLKSPQKAKEFYLECVLLTNSRGEIQPLVATYANLGAIYNSLGLYDSALYFMREGLSIGKSMQDRGQDDLSTLYNNVANSYFLKGQFDFALPYFRQNYLMHARTGSYSDIWLDEINLADAYIEKGNYSTALLYADSSLQLATLLKSRSKEADSYSILAKLYQRKPDYRKALQNLEEWYNRNATMVNPENYKNIAESQERFHARDGENEKLILQWEISRQRFNNRIMIVTAVGLLMIVGLALTALLIKRHANENLKRTNDLILRQNERFSDLNQEKNALIGIVSHDLSTPFSTIQLWSELLDQDKGRFSEEQRVAIQRIRASSAYGQRLIRNILDVEKAETRQHKLYLEQVNLSELFQSLAEDFSLAAQAKELAVLLDLPAHPVILMIDRQRIRRICENLISNAIKYSRRGGRVWMGLKDGKDVQISFRDEGVGIKQEELPFLFSKFSQISSKPTGQETSSGLGLSIVKGIVEELNGEIRCESVVGRGTVFTITFKN